MIIVRGNLPWDQILHNIRQVFFTPDILRAMENQYLFRPQHQHESLADSVRDIQIMYKILSLSTHENEIFADNF
jgi:hypothetical protein